LLNLYVFHHKYLFQAPAEGPPIPFCNGVASQEPLNCGNNSVRQWILQQETAGGSRSGPASLPLYTRSLPRPARASRAGWYRSQAVRQPAQDKVGFLLFRIRLYSMWFPIQIKALHH
jgi:hypothetical protein